MCQDVNYKLGDDVFRAIKEASEKEVSVTGKQILQQVLLNAEIASQEKLPLCQDTGFPVVFLELGQDVQITGGYLYDAIHEGIKTGYRDGFLRQSIVGDPLSREYINDAPSAVIHLKSVPGDSLKITIMPKGGGGENMSGIEMLYPACGLDGVKKFILEMIKTAGGNPCPPVTVGVGIGGTFEKVAMLAKEALLRPRGERSKFPDIAKLEEELLEEINKTGIGPQGLGGVITALAVNILVYPSHLDSLPVAVNINCHSHRHRSIVL